MGEERINFNVLVLSAPKFIDYSAALQTSGNRFSNDKAKVAAKNDVKDAIRVMKGDDVTLECFAEGSPSPKVHWLQMNFYDSSKNELLDEDGNILVSFQNTYVTEKSSIMRF